MDVIQSIFESQQQRALMLRTEGYKPRMQRLRALEKWILSHRKEIHSALMDDLIKSCDETDLTEIYTVLTEIREAIGNLAWWTKKERVKSPITFFGSVAYHVYEPKGTCLIISPWNYPFNLGIGPVVSAIAAGNTFILKPSEFTPKTSSLMKMMVADLFESDLGCVVEGDGEIAAKLLELPFDHIFFTGSQQIGKLVMNAASKNLTSVTLELGGKSPTIVDETADLKDAADKIAWGKWLNAGQTCVAPDFLFVHEKIYSRFLALLNEQIRKIYDDQDYTGIINEKHFNRLSLMVEQAVQLGAEKTEIKKEVGYGKMRPIILENITDQMQVMQEEIFGPVLPVLRFSDLKDVIKYINERPKALSLYIFSRSKSNQQTIRQATSSGTLVINDNVLHFAHPGLSFGGTNHSGFGKSHGREGFLTFSNKKAVLKQRTGFTVSRLLYPPYTKWKKSLINAVLKYF